MKSEQKKGPVGPRLTTGLCLLLIGVLLALYPFIKISYYNLNDPVKNQAKNPTIPASSLKKQSKSDMPKNSNSPDKLLPMSGRLVIPVLKLDREVFYGVDEETLKKGPGFYPQSGYPDTGNVCIAAHRNAYGSPFWYLDKLKNGDRISLYYNGKQYTYQVDSVFVTHNHDWSVIDPTDTAALTLTTCHPLQPVGGAYDRLIVRAYLISESSDN